MDILEWIILVPASSRDTEGPSVALVPIGITLLVMTVLVGRSSDRTRTLRRCRIAMIPLALYGAAILCWPIDHPRTFKIDPIVGLFLGVILSPSFLMLTALVAALAYAVVKSIRMLVAK